MESLAREYDEAFNKRDASALASLYLEDAQIIAADHEIIKGRQAIENYWKQDLASVDFKQTSTVVEVEDHGTVAVETGTWAGWKSDGTAADKGKYLLVWKRDGATWRIHRETWNTARLAATSADDELRRIHQEYDRAWLRQDAVTFERLLAADFVQVDQDGKVLSKADVIANAKSGDVKLEVGQSDDVKVWIHGDTAVVGGRWTEKGTIKGKTTEAIMRNIVVYSKINGRWHVVSDQVTVIKPVAP